MVRPLVFAVYEKCDTCSSKGSAPSMENMRDRPGMNFYKKLSPDRQKETTAIF